MKHRTDSCEGAFTRPASRSASHAASPPPAPPADPPMSRRTCAATRTVARKASRDFSRGLRVYHFGSSLWASRVLRRLARGCGRGSWEGRSGAFLKPSAVGLSPPSSDPRFALSAPAHAPSAARGCPCTACALRGYGNAPSYPPNSLRHQGRSCGLCAPFRGSALAHRGSAFSGTFSLMWGSLLG
jgi:hypothetical protein